MIDDDTFFAWLDGALSADEQARVSALVAADPVLSRRAERQRALTAMAPKSFAVDLEEPVPDRWIGMIDEALPAVGRGEVASLASARAARRARRLWGWTGAAAAVAAAAVMTIGIATSGGPQPLIAGSAGQQVASAELGTVLDKARSGSPYRVRDKAALDIQLSFRTRTGDYCRDAVLTQATGETRLIACRAPRDWQIVELVRQQGGSEGYQAASGDDAVDRTLDRLGAEPLDAAGEAEAIRNGWRPAPVPPVRSGNRRS